MWVPWQIQPTSELEIFRKIFQEVPKSKNLNWLHADNYFHNIYIVLDILCHLKIIKVYGGEEEDFLMVQQLRLWAFTAQGIGSIPCQETKIPHAKKASENESVCRFGLPGGTTGKESAYQA